MHTKRESCEVVYKQVISFSFQDMTNENQRNLNDFNYLKNILKSKDLHNA